MRHTYVVTYDIADAKRLRQVFKVMRGFGDALQYSVFRCELSAREKVLLIEKLTPTIHHTEDQVMLVDLGPVGGRVDQAVETLGRSKPAPIRRAIIV